MENFSDERGKWASCGTQQLLFPLKPTRSKATAPDNWQLESLGSIFIGLLLVAMTVVILALMCVMRWRRKEPGDDEEYGLSHSLQQLCRRLRGHHWVPAESTAEVPPIPRDQIILAYMERHKDGDYKFQQEFEVNVWHLAVCFLIKITYSFFMFQNLPDRFSDRSCHESDKRENAAKNRYPDIKAYDQTRIRLSVSDGTHSSDYINANFVVGYKERKNSFVPKDPWKQP